MSKSSKSAKGRKQKLNFDMATDLVDNTVVVGSLLGPTTATPLFAGDVSASEIVSLMRDEFSVDSQNAAFDHTVADRISNELMNLLHVIRFDIGVIKNRWLRQLETLRRGWHLVIVIEYKRSSKMKPEYMVVNQRPRHYEDVSRLARAELSKTL